MKTRRNFIKKLAAMCVAPVIASRISTADKGCSPVTQTVDPVVFDEFPVGWTMTIAGDSRIYYVHECTATAGMI